MDKVRHQRCPAQHNRLTNRSGRVTVNPPQVLESEQDTGLCGESMWSVYRVCILNHSGTRFHQRCTTLKQTLGRIRLYPSFDSSFEVLWDSSENKHLLAVLSLLTFTSHLLTLNPEQNSLAPRSLIYSNSCRLEGVSHVLKCTPAATCCSPLINLSEGAGDWMLAERHKGSGSWKGGVADLVCLTLKL